MPELPEVETTRLALEPHLAGQRIAELTVRRRDLRWPIPKGLEKTLKGKPILALRRIGKYLLIDIEGDLSLIAHLGMSGSFCVSPSLPNTLRKHDHFLLKIQSGATAIYHDPRRFGFLLPCPTADLATHPLLARMGPDPLDETACTGAVLHRAFSSRKTSVKLALMDQHVIAGIGNIYASEALFRAKIHPERPANQVTRQEANRLITAVRAVLREAMASGGSTLRDYASGDNQTGYFQHRFAVYDRAGKDCPACGNTIQKLIQSGRATYYCPRCQR
jgi:formamidopyrimidine-DNA glycosylase